MSHYKSNLRDIQFNLFEVLRRQDLLGQPPYDELDEETVRGILGELERLAEQVLAPQHLEQIELDVPQVALVVAHPLLHCSPFRRTDPYTFYATR